MTRLDLLAPVLVRHLIDAGAGMIRRVVVIGSYATGTATAGSDIDLVVLIEPPTVCWKPADNVAQRRRFESALRDYSMPVDLWVRTLDQFAEAKGVVGCPEHQAATAGVVVYDEPARRSTIVRRTAAVVRCHNVMDVLADGHDLLARARNALAVPTRPMPTRFTGPSTVMWAGRPTTAPNRASHERLAQVSALRSVTAVFVARQKLPLPTKRDSPPTILDRITEIDRDLSQTIRVPLLRDYGTVHGAARVWREVFDWLSRDGELIPYLKALATTRPIPSKD